MGRGDGGRDPAFSVANTEFIYYDMNMKYDRKDKKAARVGERGQVTIPQELRRRYGISPGQEVVFEEHEDGLILRRRVSEEPLRALFGRVREDVDVDRYLEESRGPGPEREPVDE